MKEYVIGVIGIVILSAVLTMIIPDGKTASTIKGVAKTACVAVIVAPIIHFFQAGELPDILYENSKEIFLQSGIEVDANFIQYYCEMCIVETREKLQEELREKYDLEVSVVLTWEWRENEENKGNSSEIYITQIRVYGMENQTETMKNEVKEYLSKTYCSEVQIE